MTITFVTALLDLQEERPGEKTVATYLALLETLQAAGLRLHAFLSPSYAEKVTIRNGVVDILDRADLETTARAPEGLPESRTPTKDTRAYLCLMNAKTELVHRAIASGKHSSSHYAWIDAGISHILDTPMETLQALAETPLRKQGLWIPGCPGHTFQGWDTICWRFCGGFFVGDPQTLERFHALVLDELPRLPKLSWEVNLWAFLETKGFAPTWYAADHNDSMLRPPRFEPIVRHTHIDVYWYGYLSGCRVGGALERYVESCIRDLGIPRQVVFPLSDGFQPHDDALLRRFESLSEWQPLIATLCTRNYSRDNLLYLPLDDDTFEHGLEARMAPFSRPAWESRRPMAFWRGVTSGFGRPLLRSQVVETLFSYRHANVKAVQHDDRPDDPPKFMFDRDRSSIQDHLQYKYLLIVDGGVIASSHQWMFGSGAVPIMITHPGNEYWFKKYLQPMVNYVPIRYDLSDLKEKIEWLVKNDDKAKEIAENALRFSQQVFSSAFQKRYVREEIARLVAHRPTLGIAIPCYKPHARFIPACLDGIEAQTVKPTKVVISCSSTTELPPISREYSFPIDILMVAEPQTASQNRNLAARHLDTDLISFFDVDDVMHPRRLEAIHACFEAPCDIVLHAYEDGTVVDTATPSIKIRRNVLQRAPSGCAVVADDIPAKIHHAHSTVRKEIYTKVQFREQPEYNRIEDAVFCGDVLSLPSIRSAYIATPMSAYLPSVSPSE
jgi:hypothetical protein